MRSLAAAKAIREHEDEYDDGNTGRNLSKTDRYARPFGWQWVRGNGLLVARARMATAFGRIDGP
jgi:hypothetical protein